MNAQPGFWVHGCRLDKPMPNDDEHASQMLEFWDVQGERFGLHESGKLFVLTPRKWFEVTRQ